MKNIFSLFILLTVFFQGLYAQGHDDQRLQSTKIADVLATLPGEDARTYNVAMETISKFDEAGLTEMLAMLSPEGKGNNTALEYAIGGYSFYVTAKGREELRHKAEAAYCQSLGKQSDDRLRAFLISQLQIVGTDQSVSCLAKYLNDEKTAGPAARALAAINTAAAEKVLFDVVQNAGGQVKLSLVEALGFAKYQPAAAWINGITKTAEGNLEKLGLYALANIADASSEEVLSSAARDARYTFEPSGATAAYLTYIRNIAQSGNREQAYKLASAMAKTVNMNDAVHTRIALLRLMAETNYQGTLKTILRATRENNNEYLAAALAEYAPKQNSRDNRKWVKTLKKSNADAAVQIINMLGKTGDGSVLPALERQLGNKNQEVRNAAVMAVARLGGMNSLPSLVGLLKKGNQEDIKTVSQALRLMKGEHLNERLVAGMEQMPAAAQVAILEFLSDRAAADQSAAVFKYVSGQDTAAARAAVNALASVVTENDLDRLFTLYKSSNAGNKEGISNAIVNATSSITDTAKRISLITDQMNAADADRKKDYYEILAVTGGIHSIELLQAAASSGDDASRTAAIQALSMVRGKHAAEAMLKIAREASGKAGAEASVNAFIDIIRRSDIPSEQKLIFLKEAMELAVNDNQKRRILTEAGREGTFPGMVFAASYLDVPALQQQAASSVMRIALENPSFTGNMVRGYLQKVITILKGQDSDYLRQAVQKHLNDMPDEEGFVSMFNGRDLTGWKGLVADPIRRAKMTPEVLAKEQEKADKKVPEGWVVKDGLLVFTGHGDNLATTKQYGDFEMFVDWKITKDGDAGIYLRGTPQVQIWDTSRVDVGADVGSGGLYNNQKHPSKPLVMADNAIGEWNNFHIIMKGEKVTVYLNGQLVVDNVTLENYWNRNLPIFPKEQIELQAHGTYVAYRDLYIRDMTPSTPFVLDANESREGFQVLFDGTDLEQWQGNKTDYFVRNHELVVEPKGGSGGNLYTKKQYDDFVLRFDFKLTPGANNGLGIRAPLTGDAAYEGMELQILDNTADIYKNLKPYQFHGSVYGVIPAKKGYLNPVGEWNTEEVIVKGNKVKVILNGTVIVDGDIAEASKNGTLDKRDHPGLKRKTGHIGFLGHGSKLWFRNIRIREL